MKEGKKRIQEKAKQTRSTALSLCCVCGRKTEGSEHPLFHQLLYNGYLSCFKVEPRVSLIRSLWSPGSQHARPVWEV